MPFIFRSLIGGILAISWLIQPAALMAQGNAMRSITYADVADLSYSAGLIALVRIDTLIRIADSRSPAASPGYGRFYVEAQADALLVGKKPLARSVSYLVDLPLDAHGRANDLEGQDVFIFARAVPGKPGELQLVTPTAQLRWSPSREARLRGMLNAAVSPGAPPRITGVRALLHEPGNLLGQGRTQIFLNTQDGSYASITVRRNSGTPPAWSASFSELIADNARQPADNSLEWYRLACALPATLPIGTDLSRNAAARETAAADYHFVRGSLGPCKRSLRFRPRPDADSYFSAASM